MYNLQIEKRILDTNIESANKIVYILCTNRVYTNKIGKQDSRRNSFCTNKSEYVLTANTESTNKTC